MLEPDRPSNASGTPSSDGESDETPELSEDEIFHLLQTSRRRDVIDYLLDNEGPIKMGTLAEIVSAKEHETTVAALTSTQRQRVYIPLYQKHLPKLDEKGIIEYNQPRGIVRPTDRLEVFRPYLETADSTDGSEHADTEPFRSLRARATSDYHIVATGASGSLFAASVAGLLSVSELTLAAAITTAFLLATVAANCSKLVSLNDPGEVQPEQLLTNR